jgi:type VI secretion system secreted protein Hcp
MSSNMYIKFEQPDVTPSSPTPGHAGEIEILSWSHGFTQPSSPAGGGTLEQANHSSLSFTKYLDDTSNPLLKLCWSGKQIGKATLTCYRSDGLPSRTVLYLRVTMEHVIISNYAVTGGAGDIPVENVSLDYGIVRYEYTPSSSSDSNSAKHNSVMHNLESQTVE